MKKQLITLAIAFMILVSLTSIQALTIKSVSTSPDEIAPGETATIIINIENDADYDITKVSVSLDLKEVPFAPYDSSSEDGFDEIKEDKSKTAQFRVIVLNDAKSGIYKIPMVITYYDNNEAKQTKNSLISLSVNSKPILGVSIEDGLLLNGQENELSIKIVNKGLSDIKFSEIEIGSYTYYTILSPKNVYIGDIDSNDFDTVNFKLFFKPTSPSRINLPVNIIYKDAVNKEYIESLNLELNVYSKEKAIELGLLTKSNTMLYIEIGIVIIIIYIIYRKIKKRRKMKMANSS